MEIGDQSTDGAEPVSRYNHQPGAEVQLVQILAPAKSDQRFQTFRQGIS